MPQLSLYLTQEQLTKVENAAHAEKLSLSKWVVTQIINKLEPRYPDGWADLFGSVNDASFVRPKQPELAEREAF